MSKTKSLQTFQTTNETHSYLKFRHTIVIYSHETKFMEDAYKLVLINGVIRTP